MLPYDKYKVKEYYYYIEILQNACRSYGDKTLFEYRDSKVTYNYFFEKVKIMASHLSTYDRRIFQVCAADPFLYAVSYFGVVLSNNIAALTRPGVGIYKEFDENVLKLDDNDIQGIISNTEKQILICTNNTEVCTLVSSSGTTGKKKWVRLTQKSICTDMIGGMQNYLFSEGDRYLHLLPYYHMFGIVADLLAIIHSGGTICICNNIISFYNDIVYFKPDCLNLSPLFVKGLLELIKTDSRFSNCSVKKVLCAGDQIDDNTIVEMGKYGIPVYTAYGLTECSPCITMSRDNYYKTGSVGIPISCSEIKISESGEVMTRGENLMLGYYGENDLIRSEWFKTGDLGYIDNEGFLFLRGRKSNMIVFEDGTKVYPEYIESILNKYQNVKESLVSFSNGGISAILVSDGLTEKTQQNIYEHMKEMIYPHRVTHVYIQKEELIKNELGKIIRGLYA